VSDERPYSTAALVVVVGTYRPDLSPDDARLLLHAAADALSAAGGPLLFITCPGVPQP
jgi:hypothetical protein